MRKILYESGKMPILVKIQENLFEEIAFELEIFLIKQIGRKDQSRGPLVNYTDGGEGLSGHIDSTETRIKKSLSHIGILNPMWGKCHKDDTIMKIQKSLKGRLLKSETKEKIRKSTSGEKNHMFGKNRSNEVKSKISLSLKGRSLSEETKIKISNSLMRHPGNSPSEETRKKISESLTGHKDSDETRKKKSLAKKGKPKSEEHKQKMRDAWSRRKLEKECHV